MCESSRKRLASIEHDFNRQTKLFVSDKIVSRQNEDRMKDIHKKTLAMLFNAAKMVNLSSQEGDEEPARMQLFGNGEIEVNLENLLPVKADKECKGCAKSARVQTVCCACNLTVCEFCGITCTGNCLRHLCTHCVYVFGCGTVCEQCKLYEMC